MGNDSDNSTPEVKLTLEGLMEMIEGDLRLDRSNLENKMFELPSLYSKYLKFFTKESIKYNKQDKIVSAKYRELYDYYKFDYKVKLDSEKLVDYHIISDSKYSDLNSSLKQQKIIVNTLELTLKRLSAMSFDIKNIISYQQYLNGV